MNRLALFDCDGTLVDSQHVIADAMAECFAAHGLPEPPRERTRRVIGLSLVEAMAAMHPAGDAALHAAMAESYKHAFQGMRARGSVDEPLYEGVAELIDTLESEGWLLGVATGKSDRGLQSCLDCHQLGHRFVTLQTADRHPSKPHPSMIDQAMADAGAAPQTTAMIGDTSYDMAMARAAGVMAIGVAWGYHEPEALRQAGADHVVGHPSEIMALMRTIG